MARVMKALRESIPYQEDEPSPAFALADAEKRPEMAPGAGRREVNRAGDSDEDDFARLLRTLREGIPDEPEPLEQLGEPTPYDPHRYEAPDSGGAPYSAPYDPSPLPPVPARVVPLPDKDVPNKDVIAAERAIGTAREDTVEEDLGDEEYSYPDLDIPDDDSDDAEELGDPEWQPPQFKDEAPDEPDGEAFQPLEVTPGEQAVIAELLRSIHDEEPGRDLRPLDKSSPSSLGAAAFEGIDKHSPPADEFGDDDGSDRGQVWKVALALGSAAALGLFIALVNPFGDKVPPSQGTVRVVVPVPPPPAPHPPAQLAEIKPVVVPLPPVAAPAPVAARPPAAEPPPPPAPKPTPAPVQVAALPPVAAPPPAPEPPPTPAPPPVAAAAPKAEPVIVEAPKPPPPKPEPVVAEAPKPTPPKPEPVKVEAPKPTPPKPEPVVVAKARSAEEPQIAPEERVAAAAGTPVPTGPRVLTVQVGSFKIADNADRLIKSLKEQGFDAYGKDWTDHRGQVWHVVRVGRVSERDRTAATGLAHKLRGKAVGENFVFSVQAP